MTMTTYDPLPDLVQIRDLTDDEIPRSHIDRAIEGLSRGEPLYRVRSQLRQARAVQQHLEHEDGVASLDLALGTLGT